MWVTRYPNGFDAGAPRDYYASGEAGQAITDAESVYQFCGENKKRLMRGGKFPPLFVCTANNIVILGSLPYDDILW